VRALFAEKLAEVREQQARLRALESELMASLRFLEECTGCSRPVNTTCAHCAEPGHEAASTPPLVNGIVQRQ